MTATDPGGLPIASLTFLGLLAVGFAWQALVLPGQLVVPAGLAFIPGSLFGGADLPAGAAIVPPPATLVTYLFVHAGWLQLFGNLLFLGIVGPRVEASLGPGRWTVLLLACGVAAALAGSWADPSSPAAMVGASGAISGLLGACVVIHPRDRLRLPGVLQIHIPVSLVLFTWLALQLVQANWPKAVPGGISFGAHSGAFACGLLLVPVLHFLALLSADARPVARTLRSRDSSH